MPAMTRGGVSLAALWTWASPPAAAAVPGGREEISADVQLVCPGDVLGGSNYVVSYPNGDRTAYVTTVYEARIINGYPAPGDGELSELVSLYSTRVT